MAPLLWGEIPSWSFLQDPRRYREFIERNLQIPLFPRFQGFDLYKPPPPPTPIYRDKNGREVSPILWHQQPLRFWNNRIHRPRYGSQYTDPHWREKYEAEWAAKRKALGIPHAISNPYRRKKDGRLQAAR